MNVIELERSLRQLHLEWHGRGDRNSLAPGSGRNHGSYRSDLLAWSRTNSPFGPTACCNAAANKPAFAIPIKPSIISTSPSIRR